MDLLQNLENYLLDLLLLDDIDTIFQERLASYELINKYNSDNTLNNNYDAIEFLLTAIKEKPLIDLRKSEENKILKDLVNLFDSGKIPNESDVNNMDNNQYNDIHQYFFNKVIIELKIEEFNLLPFNDEELEFNEEMSYPDRVFVENQFDLMEDIENLIEFLIVSCFNGVDLTFENISNKAIKYKYFFDLLIYQINMISFTKNIYKDALDKLILFREKINNAIEYNIPLKID